MILRARVKTAEEMPPGSPCCERMKERLAAFAASGKTVNVMPAKAKRCHCQDCKAPFMGVRVHGLRGWRIDPRCWEIEEAPAEEVTPGTENRELRTAS
jgi:hypothetical protein